MQSESSDITRVVLFVLVLGVLLVGSAWTLLPFLSALTWATTIAIATWPVLLRLQRLAGTARAGGRDHDPSRAALFPRAICTFDQHSSRCGGSQPRDDG